METLNAYQLANLADCASPDTNDSPGARFLLGVQDDVNEVMGAWENGPSDYDLSDEAHMIADQAAYNAEARGTYNKWLTFVDLAAWQQDTDEWGPFEDMNKAADIALYTIARTLAERLIEEAAQTSDEDDEDEDDL